MSTTEPPSADPLLDEDVAAQLEQLLADPRFVTARRSARFLRYIVEETLAGRADAIKEVVIAAEIYGRVSDYDPKVDSAVRVQASRLRAKLERYYSSSGARHAIRIVIPKGGYVPRFERATARLASDDEPTGEAPVAAPDEARARLALKGLQAVGF